MTKMTVMIPWPISLGVLILCVASAVYLVACAQRVQVHKRFLESHTKQKRLKTAEMFTIPVIPSSITKG